MSTVQRIAFLGLGVMGGPMAGHLARAGHKVTGYNRTASRAEAWRDKYRGEGLDVSTAPAPVEAAIGQDVVITCVGNDDDLDAPVSGGQAGAENGKLAIMCGGSAQAMDRARPVMQAYGARMVHIGEAGAGQATKAVNQICIAGTLAGLS